MIRRVLLIVDDEPFLLQARPTILWPLNEQGRLAHILAMRPLPSS
jgi:hypothetical protein